METYGKIPLSYHRRSKTEGVCCEKEGGGSGGELANGISEWRQDKERLSRFNNELAKLDKLELGSRGSGSK